METANKFVIVVCGVLLSFFLVALAMFSSRYTDAFIDKLLIAQLIVFSAAAGAVVVYSAKPLLRDRQSLAGAISKIVMLSDANVPTDEFLLINRTSALIAKGDSGYVYISLEGDFAADEYAILNRVDGAWYIERLSESKSVGLRRAGEQYVYKLKSGMFYKLRANDIIHIEKERLLLV